MIKKTKFKKYQTYLLIASAVCAFMASVMGGYLIGQSGKLPESLVYNGYPVDAACLATAYIGERTNPVSLAECSGKIPSRTPLSASLIKGGYIGYEYQYANDVGMKNSAVMYKYVGKIQNDPAILIRYIGPDDIPKTHIEVVHREGDSIRTVQSLGSGQGCQGGIVEAGIYEKKIYYDASMTPVDILSFVFESDPNAQMIFDGLETRNKDCLAVGRYYNGKLSGIKLQAKALETPPSQGYEYQNCFNDVMKSYIQNDKDDLGIVGIRAFARDFVRKCH